jgi:hypothetical protein
MVKNNKFWKSFGRLSCWIALLVTLLLLSPACDELKTKTQLVKDLMQLIKEEEQALRPKEKDLTDLTAKYPKVEDRNRDPNVLESFESLKRSINREQTTLDVKNASVRVILDDMAKEVNDLSKPSSLQQIIAAVVETLRGRVPSEIAAQIIKEIMERLKKAGKLTNEVHDGVENKLNALSTIRDEQMAIIDRWEYHSAEPNELRRMDQLIAEADTISLDEEVELVGEIARELNQIVPSVVPVVAGSVVDRGSFIIEEGHPPRLEDLDDGILAPGSVIILQLPPTWTLTAPVTIEPNNNNLSLDICGNQPGSSLIEMRVVSAIEPNRPDDSIVVTFNGVQIGNRTGIVSGSLTVLPGRTSTQDFVVLPPGCRPPPLADMTYDGTVNFKDLAVLANEWLTGTERPPVVPTIGNPDGTCPQQPGFMIRTVKKADDNWGNNDNEVYQAMNDLLDGKLPKGVGRDTGPPDFIEISEESRISRFVNLYDSGGNRGEFVGDEPYPCVDPFTMPTADPADGDDDDNYATEASACIQLTAGYHIIAVNSDDGTIIKIGGVEIGRTGAWKGASTDNFLFNVLTPGLYSFQARNLEGGGGSALELHEVLPNGSRILLGDVANGGSPVYAFPE